MNIFNIIRVLEDTSGCTCSAHITNNEMIVHFKKGKTSVKHCFTDEEIESWTVSHWASFGGDVKLKIKSRR